MVPQIINVPSNANHPDLDWSQIMEAVKMLNLAVAQIEHSMRVGEDSVQTLTDSFTTMAGYVKSLDIAISKNISEGEVKSLMQSNCSAVSERVHCTIIAFQFYDNLCQHLNHVSNSLSALGDLIANKKRLYDPNEWLGLQEKIKSRYTLDTDRQMFEDVLQGKTIEEVLNNALQKKEKEKDDDIELF